MSYIEKKDKVVYDAIQKEFQRQNSNIELIASENFVSQAVMELSLIHISEPTRPVCSSRMPSSA